MQDKKPYEYAVIRLVPRVEREEFLNVGVVIYAASQKFLQVKFYLDKERLRVFFGNLDVDEIQKYLESFDRICKGGGDAGPIGALPMAQRFRWLTAIRSTVVQVSNVHTGICVDPAEKLIQLLEQLVLWPIPQIT